MAYAYCYFGLRKNRTIPGSTSYPTLDQNAIAHGYFSSTSAVMRLTPSCAKSSFAFFDQSPPNTTSSIVRVNGYAIHVALAIHQKWRLRNQRCVDPPQQSAPNAGLSIIALDVGDRICDTRRCSSSPPQVSEVLLLPLDGTPGLRKYSSCQMNPYNRCG